MTQPLAELKSMALTAYILTEAKEGLRTIAEQELCSLANMIEIEISDYCSQSGAAINKTGITS